MKLGDIITLALAGYKSEEMKDLTAAGYTADQLKDLAKAGYKPADIKELLTLVDEDAGGQKPTETQQKDAVPPETEKPKEKPADADASSTEDKYKEEIANLQKQLADLQKQNTNKDVSGGVSDPQEVLNKIVQDMM